MCWKYHSEHDLAYVQMSWGHRISPTAHEEGCMAKQGKALRLLKATKLGKAKANSPVHDSLTPKPKVSPLNQWAKGQQV